MVEIDENELSTLRNSAKFLEQIEKLEDGRSIIQKLGKRINPRIRTEEDTVKEYTKPLEEKLENLVKFKEDLSNKISSYNKEESWERVKNNYGYTEEGLKSLREFAEKNGINNPIHAAGAWEKENPPKSLSPAYSSDSFTVGEMINQNSSKEEELKLMRESPALYEEQQIRKFYEEKQKSNNGWKF